MRIKTMRNSVEVVAMRKLASSNIFDVVFYYTGMDSEEGFYQRENFRRTSLTLINKYFKELVYDHLKSIDMGRYSDRGFIQTKDAYYGLEGKSTKYYIFNHINSRGDFDPKTREQILVRIQTKALNKEDLESILRLGLDIEKLRSKFKPYSR